MRFDFRGDVPLVDGKPIGSDKPADVNYPETRAAIKGYYASGRSMQWADRVHDAFIRESGLSSIEGLDSMTPSYILWMLDGGQRMDSTRCALLELLEENRRDRTDLAAADNAGQDDAKSSEPVDYPDTRAALIKYKAMLEPRAPYSFEEVHAALLAANEAYCREARVAMPAKLMTGEYITSVISRNQ